MKTFQSGKSAKELHLDTTRKFIMVSDNHNVFKKGEILSFVEGDQKCDFAIFKNDKGIKVSVYFFRLEYFEDEWKPVSGEVVYAGPNKDKRIYLATIEGSAMPYVCVHRLDEEDFRSNKSFYTENHAEIYRIETKEEMTLEEVCKELGRDIKIVK